MPLIELPNALEHYFAFAETEPTRRGRRFAITLPYYSGDRLERIQWWYHVSPAQELQFDGRALLVYRARAADRFRRHIEQWLVNTDQRLHGDEAIPRISPANAEVAGSAIESEESSPSELDAPTALRA